MLDIKILVADDDKNFRRLIADFLRNEGFKVYEAQDGEGALNHFFEENEMDLIILDVMMPVLSGWEVCEEIRSYSEVPIIMLTALGEAQNEIQGLHLGADDYISKPFSYEVFMARVQANLRRAKKEKDSVLIYKGIQIDENRHEVLVDADVVDMSPREYNLLIYLVKNSGRALTRDQILNTVWGYDYNGDRRTVDTHIKSLRAKLGEHGEEIQTIRGLGYKLGVRR